MIETGFLEVLFKVFKVVANKAELFKVGVLEELCKAFELSITLFLSVGIATFVASILTFDAGISIRTFPLTSMKGVGILGIE